MTAGSAVQDHLDNTDFEIVGFGGVSVPVRTLYYDQTSEYEARIVSTPDRMRVYMQVAPGARYAGVGRARLQELIELSGVSACAIEAGVTLYASLLQPPTPYAGYFQIARGEPRRRGEDGSIEFHVQPTAFAPRYNENDEGAIDYKQLNLIENCFAGQRVASILPPGPGRPGKDIFGDEIPPQPGNPIPALAGPGVMVSSNGRDFTSEIEGRVVLEDNVISVSPVLEIYRDIDYSVGNVDFVGKVVLNGSLLDGFYISAKHGVEISGDMGAARIVSEGDVTIRGGVKGKNVAFISCRNLSARYLDDASVETTGDVEMNKEILNCNVKSLGRVSIPNGTIIGGEVCGFRGVEAETIGSEMGVPTRVMAGLNWTDEDRLQEMRGRIAEYMDRAQSAKVLIDPLLDNRELVAHLSSEQKSMLSELISELRELKDALADVLDDRSKITSQRQTGLVAQINVSKLLHMGVSARFPLVESPVKDAIKGPLSITQDEKNKTIRIGSFTPLPKIRDDVPDGGANGEGGG